MFGIHASAPEIVQYVGVFALLVLVVLVARIGSQFEAWVKSQEKEAQ